MAIRKRAFGLALLIVTFSTFPVTARVSLFNQQDIDRLMEVNNAIQALKQDVTATLKSLPSYQVETIQSYAVLELSLEAAQERINSVFVLVATANQMEIWNDEARILNGMYGTLLPSSKTYLNSKRTAIISIASAHTADNMFIACSNRAATILGGALQLIDELYRRIATIHK